MEATLHTHLNDIYNKCLHCGLCLPTCPTYNIDLREESSPRGRIQLMYAVENKSIPLSDKFVNEIYYCLDCQACETACPAGVRYGELVEASRNVIGESNKDHYLLRIVKNIFLRGVLSSSARTKLFGRLLYWYAEIGLRNAIEESGILKIISPSFHEKHRLLPKADRNCFDESVNEIIHVQNGEKRGRIAFLSGCIMNISFTKIHQDAVRVLNLNGFEIVIPKKQVCCGSLHSHNGDLKEAKRLAKINIEVFEKYQFDYLVVDSAGCSAFMKEYGKFFADEPDYAERAKNLSYKIKEITEFLSEVGLSKIPEKYSATVTYHDACHLVHTQKISRQPRGLLQNIPGVKLIELSESSWCCGSAGIYNVVRYDDSMKILDRKMENIKSTGAAIVTTANPGCHLQLEYGIEKKGLKMEVLHPVSILSRAYAKTLDH